jgi:hypothetical protein
MATTTTTATTGAARRVAVAEPWWRWLAHGAADHPKHAGWSHPAAVLFVHYAVVDAVTLLAHDALLERFVPPGDRACYPREEEEEEDGGDDKPRRTTVAYFLALYAAWLLVWRVWFCTPRTTVLYEKCWMCNVTLAMGAVALFTGRPVVAAAHCVAVGTDQVLWYVDCAAYAVRRRFPVGVARYVVWPGTAWQSRVTCTHHLWTLPVLLRSTRGVHWTSLPLSFVVVVTNVLLSRWMTPPYVVINSNNNRNENDRTAKSGNGNGGTMSGSASSPPPPSKYLNVNCSHGLWKDIKFAWLQINHDDPPVHKYLYRLLWRWQAFNFAAYVVLYAACRCVFGEDPPVC